jgi:hypothetical protein
VVVEEVLNKAFLADQQPLEVEQVVELVFKLVLLEPQPQVVVVVVLLGSQQDITVVMVAQEL